MVKVLGFLLAKLWCFLVIMLLLHWIRVPLKVRLATRLLLMPTPLLGVEPETPTISTAMAAHEIIALFLDDHKHDLAEAVVGNEILPQLVYSLSEQNRFYKKAAAFVLRAVAKHSPELAQAVVDSGALESLVVCLEEFDPSVKEAAAWALGYIAGHTGELAQAVVDAGAVPLLVLCVQEPEISLKRIAASALSDIAKHSPELAQAVVDASAVTYLAALITHPDTKLKRQVCMGLAQVAKHSVDLAEVVVEAEIFPKILKMNGILNLGGKTNSVYKFGKKYNKKVTKL